MRLGPCRRFVILVECLLMVTSVATAAELAAQPKTPVPDADAQQTARKAAGELFAERFKQAKTTAEKTALATDMMDAAGKVQDGSPDQYVLLKIAADIAATAGDAPTALQAVEKVAERFDVPGPKLTAETLLAAAGNASTTSQHKAVGEAVLKIVDAVAGAEEYKLALDLCESARSSAQKARQYSLAKELAATIEDIQKRQRAFQEYKAAWALMQEDPAEPAANLTAGRYLCLVKGDWLKGVPMLALGSDTALKNVALMELRGAKSAEQQAAIGDAWWDAAETRQGEERNLLRLRAGFWYRQAEPQLAGGLAGIKIKQRLAEVAKLGREIPATSDEPVASEKPAPSERPPLAIAPFDERTAKQHQVLWAKYLKVPVVQTNCIGMTLVLIPAGEFLMGSPDSDNEASGDEKPQHSVRITEPFYLGAGEVTQAQYQRVMGNDPSNFKDPSGMTPVEQVSWCAGSA